MAFDLIFLLRDEAPGALTFVSFTFQGVVNFPGGFRHEEGAAEDQYQVAARYALAHHLEKVRGQPHDPGKREQQQNAHEHGQAKTEHAAAGTLLRRQATGEYGDEDDVVDPEHDLEDRQRDERGPNLRVGEKLHNLPSAG